MRLFLWLLLMPSCLFAQKNIPVNEIPEKLKQHAFSVINEELVEVKVLSYDRFTVNTKKTITVLNEKGLGDLNFDEYYTSKSRKIKNIRVSMYDDGGNLQRTFKKSDFKDYSLNQGVSISDSRLLSLDFKPSKYPVIFVFESEVESKNTAFLPKWYPIQTYGQSVLVSKFSIEVPATLKLNSKIYNEGFYPIEEKKEANAVQYTLRNFPALLDESLSPNFQRFIPKGIFSLDQVNLEQVAGSFSNWEELGNWYYANLVKGTETLSPATKAKVQELVKGVDDPIEKAKILYEYMQSKTRYISIQLGIGGWQPMHAKEVDALGYGDCKGLTNYLRAMLKEVGVETYPVLLYGSSTPIDIESESVCLQGNHMILALPVENGYQWIECTSQKAPFGFIGGFTDNRNVLVVKEKGSELVQTKKYSYAESLQKSNTVLTLDQEGNALVDIKIESSGVQFDNRFFTYSLDSKEKEKLYKRLFSDFKNIQFSTLNVALDSENTLYKEFFTFKTDKYAQKLGNRLVLALGNWNTVSSTLTNARNRVTPFYLKTDWQDLDQVEIIFPAGYILDVVPEDIEIKSKFGDYIVQFNYENNQLKYQRSLHNIGGIYTKEEYGAYKEFREKVNQADQLKIVLKQQK